MKSSRVSENCGSILVLMFTSVTTALDFPGQFAKPFSLDDPPMWISPCFPGDPKAEGLPQGTLKINETANSFQRVQAEAKSALDFIDGWKDEWSIYVYNGLYDNVLDDLKQTIPPTFLPKETDRPEISIGAYDERIVVLQDLQERLKLVALGFEQLVTDQYDQRDKFAKKMYLSYLNLKMVLCEVYVTMYELVIPEKFPDVDRSLMTASDREKIRKKQEDLDQRNFHIIRQYRNMMAYTVKAMDDLAWLATHKRS